MKEGFTGERSIVLPQMTIDLEANDPLASSLYITDIGYYPHAEGHYRERRQPIGEHVLIYCMVGEGWYSIGNYKYKVRANQYFILPPNMPHTYAADKDNPWTIYWIHFTGPHATIYSEGVHGPQDIRPAMNSRISERNNIFEEIFSTLARSTDMESLRYASSLLHYYLASMRYLRLYRQAEADKDNSHTNNADSTENLISATIHFMRENLEKRLTLEQIAHYTGYSPSHFSTLFRQRTAQSPLAYFNQLKIERACQLLTDTDMQINQICHLVGIDDSYYFSRLFKQYHGISPKQYRSQHRSAPLFNLSKAE
jgi:AraC-like DNA-binding protein